MTAQRDVIYTLKVVFDEAASKQAVDRMTAVTNKAEKSSTVEAEKSAKEKEKLDARVFTNRMKLLDRIAKEQRKKEKEELAEAERTAKEKQKQEEAVFKNRVRLLDRIAKEKKRKEAEELAETKQNLQAAERMHAASMAKIEALGERLKGSIGQGAEGFMKMARGAAVLGVAGEKDLQKLLEALAKIQAAFDIARGAMDLYFAISNGVKAYRDAVLAATAAENGLALARARAAAAGIGSGGAGGAAATAAGVGIGGATLAAGALALTGVGAAGLSAYDIAAGDPSRLPEERGTGFFARASEMAQFATPMAADYLFGTSFTQQQDEYGFNRGLRQQYEQQNLEMLGREAERAADRIRALGESAAAAATFQNDLGNFLAMSQLPGEDRLAGVTGAQAMVTARSERLTADYNRMRQSNEGVTAEQTQQFLDEQQALAQNQVDLARERLTIEMDIMNTKRDEALTSLTSMQNELELAKRIAEVERERLMSAQERFGAMSEEQQQRIIAAKKKAEESGAESLTREEAALLRSVGLESTSRIARQADIARAEAAGFGEVVTEEDLRAGREAEARAANLQVQIEDQRKVVVQIEQDAENLQNQLIAAIKEAYAAQQQALEAAVQNAAKTAADQARRELQQRAIADQQARSGG